MSVSTNVIEAARVDGAGERRILTGIIFPGLRPTLYTITMISFLNSFKVFREAYLVAGAYPHESIYLLQHLFNNWFNNMDIDKMAAAAVTVFALIFAAIVFLQKAWDSEEDTKYISVGDSVRIGFRNGKKTLNDCTVKLIAKNEGDLSYKAVIPLEDTELFIGEIGELSVSTLSKNKSGVVPLSAVTIESGKNGHIYVLEEVEGFLGVELVARKVNVQVEDSNNYYYALPELGIDPQAKIVVSSTKKLSDGQRVIGLHI